ncbi:unannotated protein [freshwater metagenome]|uniref:Unannotated protein n=1 Tax=freshwater metagenome TaxID=449393 RepID=A0A6J7DCY0_9ZZZZ|nr:prepilin-type N-terminal cleavage/methylation domain-containing protein [Actinomycetota bacterium]
MDRDHNGSVMDIATHEEIDCAIDTSAADGGFSLVELIMTIALMAILIAPLMVGVVSTIRASSNTRVLAQVQTVLQNAADRVNRAPKKCDYTVYAQAAAQSEGWAADRASIVQSRFVPAASPTSAGSWVSGACSGAIPEDLLVQVITITVTSPTGSVQSSIQVVKSDI